MLCKQCAGLQLTYVAEGLCSAALSDMVHGRCKVEALLQQVLAWMRSG